MPWGLHLAQYHGQSKGSGLRPSRTQLETQQSVLNESKLSNTFQVITDSDIEEAKDKTMTQDDWDLKEQLGTALTYRRMDWIVAFYQLLILRQTDERFLEPFYFKSLLSINRIGSKN